MQLLLLLPLVLGLAASTSHVMVSLGSSSYELGSQGAAARHGMMPVDNMPQMDMASMKHMDMPMQNMPHMSMASMKQMDNMPPMAMDDLPPMDRMPPMPVDMSMDPPMEGMPLPTSHPTSHGAFHPPTHSPVHPSHRVLADPVVHPHQPPLVHSLHRVPAAHHGHQGHHGHHAVLPALHAVHHPVTSPHHPVAHTAHHPVAHAAHHPVAHAAHHPVAHAAHHPVAHTLHHPVAAHNCSVDMVVQTGEVCVPTITTNCAPVKLMVKRVVEKQQCQEITKTVCSEGKETIDNVVCVFTYIAKAVEAMASKVVVSYSKECMKHLVTECEPTHAYGQGYCKEVALDTCYNTPMVEPIEETITLTLPEAVEKCENRPIMVPTVTCLNMVEERCFMVPQLVEDMEMVERCEAMVGPPTCSMVELTLPRQVCSIPY